MYGWGYMYAYVLCHPAVYHLNFSMCGYAMMRSSLKKCDAKDLSSDESNTTIMLLGKSSVLSPIKTGPCLP